ncbi:hypothetical protein ACFY4C_35175 [Actinomadura viridis]|uniref:hypothetical protein n=1 Tax=Actinomadura viridis TaxID=58110 RepID=UPI0036B1E959
MRLLSITAVGTALIAAGLAAPASGEESAAGGMWLSPEVAHPGERVRVRVPACAAGTGEAGSPAFAARAGLAEGTATAQVRRTAGASTYTVTASCGGRTFTGRLVVSTERSWPSLLPGALNLQMARATQDDH